MSSGEDSSRTSAGNAGETGVAVESGAECGALGADLPAIDPDLQAIIDAWPALSKAVKADIMVMIASATETIGECGSDGRR